MRSDKQNRRNFGVADLVLMSVTEEVPLCTVEHLDGSFNHNLRYIRYMYKSANVMLRWVRERLELVAALRIKEADPRCRLESKRAGSKRAGKLTSAHYELLGLEFFSFETSDEVRCLIVPFISSSDRHQVITRVITGGDCEIAGPDQIISSHNLAVVIQ